MGRHKLTPWFDGSIDPMRAGEYDTDLFGRCYWDGFTWRTVMHGPPFRLGTGRWRGEAQPRNGTHVLEDERLD